MFQEILQLQFTMKDLPPVGRVLKGSELSRKVVFLGR